jgi:hypothetical protein
MFREHPSPLTRRGTPLARRHLLTLLAGTAATLLAPRLRAATPAPRRVEVWKAPDCGCCKDWIAHLKTNGFETIAHDTGNAAMRQRLGLPTRLGSCHTARVGGYVIEGHVPAREIQRLLRERPMALGLAVPGMPVGSPGMDGPDYKGRKDPYDVLLVQADGNTRIYQSYR